MATPPLPEIERKRGTSPQDFQRVGMDAQLSVDFDDLAAKAAVAIHCVAPDGRILWANCRELEALGYGAAEYVGRNIVEFHVDRWAVDDMLNRLLNGEEIVRRRMRLRHRDGHTVHAIVSSNTLMREDRPVYTRCYSVLSGAMSPNVPASGGLPEGAAGLSPPVVQTKTELIARVAPSDGTLLRANAALCAFFGRGEEELIGRTLSDLIAGNAHVGLSNALASVAPHSIIARHRGSLARHDGAIRYLDWTLTGIVGEDWQLSEVQLFGRDVTEQVVAERALEESRYKARERERELERTQRAVLTHVMSAGLAHQVNQPLSSVSVCIGSCLEKVKRRYGDDRELLELLDRALDQVMSAGDQVREFTSGLGTRERQTEQLDVNECVRGVIQMMRGTLDLHDIDLERRFDKALPPIDGVSLEIEQVILNLLSNAIEAVSGLKDRTVRISTYVRGEDVVIEVADSGPGMPRDFSDEMLKSFYSTKADGLGMGLSIALSIVERHAGRIEIGGNVPHGALLSVCFPASATGPAGTARW